MRENLFDMGSGFGDGWSSDNKLPLERKTVITKEPKEHKLHFAREKRNGKVVTIVKPFYLDEQTAKELLKSLKKSLATGGTIKEDAIEFQGEVREKLKTALEKLGYELK